MAKVNVRPYLYFLLIPLVPVYTILASIYVAYQADTTLFFGEYWSFESIGSVTAVIAAILSGATAHLLAPKKHKVIFIIVTVGISIVLSFTLGILSAAGAAISIACWGNPYCTL